jgi:hypothetical protein
MNVRLIVKNSGFIIWVYRSIAKIHPSYIYLCDLTASLCLAIKAHGDDGEHGAGIALVAEADEAVAGHAEQVVALHRAGADAAEHAIGIGGAGERLDVSSLLSRGL